ncbi:hypothetical protein LDJ79_01140 [Vibrio tritonius]|uniref:Type II secretion system protein GspC N-terminal domain-containing protein n=1 Tax=Vibrio tritonius TaxID=1435069 RepID=A0ABS7YKG7_9VIBR|nr:hypothetical protein [Vibrio tritonius]MCA2014694.1 hypothetical protein [Vibrio tritonius]
MSRFLMLLSPILAAYLWGYSALSIASEATSNPPLHADSQWRLPSLLELAVGNERNPFAPSVLPRSDNFESGFSRLSVQGGDFELDLVGVVVSKNEALAIISDSSHELFILKEGERIPMSGHKVKRIFRGGIELISITDKETAIGLILEDDNP